MTQRLQRIFDYYCRLVPQASSLDNVKWMKALSDLGLLNESNVTRQDADLIFIQVVLAPGYVLLPVCFRCGGAVLERITQRPQPSGKGARVTSPRLPPLRCRYARGRATLLPGGRAQCSW